MVILSELPVDFSFQVEFAPPQDYKDPQKVEKHEEEMVDLSKLMPAPKGFVAFSGESSRLAFLQKIWVYSSRENISLSFFRLESIRAVRYSSSKLRNSRKMYKFYEKSNEQCFWKYLS